MVVGSGRVMEGQGADRLQVMLSCNFSRWRVVTVIGGRR